MDSRRHREDVVADASRSLVPAHPPGRVRGTRDRWRKARRRVFRCLYEERGRVSIGELAGNGEGYDRAVDPLR